jgi:hypothetical protein
MPLWASILSDRRRYRMKPRRTSRWKSSPTAQLPLLLGPSPLLALDAAGRVGLVAVLARLLAEAARAPEADDDPS